MWYGGYPLHCQQHLLTGIAGTSRWEEGFCSLADGFAWKWGTLQLDDHHFPDKNGNVLWVGSIQIFRGIQMAAGSNINQLAATSNSNCRTWNKGTFFRPAGSPMNCTSATFVEELGCSNSTKFVWKTQPIASFRHEAVTFELLQARTKTTRQGEDHQHVFDIFKQWHESVVWK